MYFIMHQKEALGIYTFTHQI